MWLGKDEVEGDVGFRECEIDDVHYGVINCEFDVKVNVGDTVFS